MKARSLVWYYGKILSEVYSSVSFTNLLGEVISLVVPHPVGRVIAVVVQPGSHVAQFDVSGVQRLHLLTRYFPPLNPDVLQFFRIAAQHQALRELGLQSEIAFVAIPVIADLRGAVDVLHLAYNFLVLLVELQQMEFVSSHRLVAYLYLVCQRFLRKFCRFGI